MPTTSPNRYLPQLPHTADRIRPWILLFLIWLSGWGISTIYSLFTLGSAENSDNPWSSGLDALLNTTLLTGTSLACLIIALRTYKIRPAALGLTIPLRPTSLYWLPAAFLMALGAVLILNLTQDLITTLTPVTPPTPSPTTKPNTPSSASSSPAPPKNSASSPHSSPCPASPYPTTPTPQH